MRHTLVVATKNRGKLHELGLLLEGLPIDLVAYGDVLPRPLEVDEDGETFQENAVKKATVIAHAAMMLTLADDSGLEVDALHGAPGVRSARFAHARATDAENNAALIAALDALSEPERDQPAFKARFRCVLALVDPYGNDAAPHVVDGTCEGSVTRNARGSGGFGYDPLFLVEGTDRTMAELSDAEKNTVSHRARAVGKMRLVLEKVLAEREAATRRTLA